MGKDKLKRFKQNLEFQNVIEPTREQVLQGLAQKGNWKKYFKNDNPIVLELGCGGGEYTVDLAKRNLNKNYIGIDIKGARIWKGAKICNDENINNVVFLRTRIELIDFCFAESEISEIWITFPDPQIKFRKTKHRLTSEGFLKKYTHILNNSGIVHLKTDSEFMYGYTLGLLNGKNHEILISQHDVYGAEKNTPKEVTQIQTHYEKIFLKENKKITYIKFRLKF